MLNIFSEIGIKLFIMSEIDKYSMVVSSNLLCLTFILRHVRCFYTFINFNNLVKYLKELQTLI